MHVQSNEAVRIDKRCKLKAERSAGEYITGSLSTFILRSAGCTGLSMHWTRFSLTTAHYLIRLQNKNPVTSKQVPAHKLLRKCTSAALDTSNSHQND